MSQIERTYPYGDGYPPHPISTNIPMHRTQTELKNDRKAALRNSANALHEKHQKLFPARVPEKPVVQENYVEKPIISHVKERAEADYQASRVSGGLLPVGSFVNPEREQKSVGLEYVEDPQFKSRSQLLEAKKEFLRRDLQAQREYGEATVVPLSVRMARKENAGYEFRRPPKDVMTLTKLRHQRKVDRMEYDMANFKREMEVRSSEREYPRFSDQEHPWWVLDSDYQPNPYTAARIPYKPAPVCFKVTEMLPPSSPRLAKKEVEEEKKKIIIGSAPGQEKRDLQEIDDIMDPYKCKTVKRWTTGILEHGSGRNALRLFDALRPAQVYARDFVPLDTFSSFDLIRNKALKEQAEARKRFQTQPTISRLQANLGVSTTGHSLLKGSSSSPALHPLMSKDQPSGEPVKPHLSTLVNFSPPSYAPVRSGGFVGAIADELKLRAGGGRIKLEKLD